MKAVIDIGNRYIKESDWKTITLLKFCLCAMGIMIGLKVPREKKQIWGCAAFSVFMACYVPLIWKLVVLMQNGTCEE